MRKIAVWLVVGAAAMAGADTLTWSGGDGTWDTTSLNWNNGTNAGVFYLNGNNDRSNTNGNIGFRSAPALFVRPEGQGLAGT